MIDPLLKPPEALMRAIAADLKPVKPSPRPLRLALLTVPHALVVSSLVRFPHFGMRLKRMGRRLSPPCS